MEADLTALPQPSFPVATGLASVRCLWHDLEEVEEVLEGSLEEVAVAVGSAAGASTTLVVPRGYPLGLEAATGLFSGVEPVAAAELAVVLDLVSVVEVADIAWAEVLAGLALVGDREVVEGLALVEQGAWEDLVEGWVVAGVQRDLVVAHRESVPSKK